MSSLNSFNQRGQNPAANINLRVGVEQNPDQAATKITLGRRFGLPAEAIEQDLQLFKGRAAAEDAQQVVFDRPKTAAWLAAHPNNAKVAHDDVSTLTKLEGYAVAPFTWARDNILFPIARGIDGVFLDDTPARLSVPAVLKQTPTALASGGFSLLSGLAGVAEAGSEAGSNYSLFAWGERKLFGGDIENKMAVFFRNIRRTAGEKSQEWAPDVKQVPGFTGQAILGGVQSVPTSLAAVGTTLVTGNPWLGAAVGGGVQGGQSYGKARDEGVGVGKSLLYAGFDAAVETGTEFFPEAKFLKETKAGSSILKRFLATQLQEQLGEQAATALQDLSAWVVLPENKDKTFGDYLAARPSAALATAIQTLVVGGVTSGVVSGIERAANLPALQARRERALAQQSAAETEQLRQFMEVAAQSKLRERDPVGFADFLQSQVEDGPLEHVYVDGRALQEVLAQGGQESAALVQAVPAIRDQLQQAIETGGDVRIPTSQLMTALPGTALEQPLLDHLRVDPLSQSAAEVKADSQEVMNRLQQGFEEQLASQQVTDEFRASREAVTQHFTDALNRANRFTSDVNERYASLLGAFYSVQGAKLGLTPEQMLERYPLQVRAVDNPTHGPNRLGQVEAAPLVNIGLARPDGKPDNTPGEVVAALRMAGADVSEMQVHKSDTEDTVVARLSHPLTPDQAHAVSEALGQEAIAQHVNGQGELYGPSAEGWRPFNPDYFLTMDGTRLSDAAAADGVLFQGANRAQKLEALKQTIPGLAKVMPYLTDDEKAKLREDTARKITEMVESFPSAEEMASVAYAGRAKRGWYERSALALLNIFGMEDAPRFAALLAALSPQTSVESNTINALQMWTNWDRAGRPTDAAAIKKLLGKSVQGNKGEGSVLGAWINNTVAALSAEQSGNITLSGPKVNSFMLNLMGVMDEVTNDAWMANYALLAGDTVFKKTGASPGKSAGYIAFSALVRRAASILSDRTGDLWTPAEVQETVWSWTKTVTEMRAGAGSTTVDELLNAGYVTHADVGATPDFAGLFQKGIYRRILEAGGYGEIVDELGAALGDKRTDGSLRGEGSVADASGSGIDPLDFAAHLNAAGSRIEGRVAEQLASKGAGAAAARARRRGAVQPDLFDDPAVYDLTPLVGLPGTIKVDGVPRQFGPLGQAREAARRYALRMGFPYSPPRQYAKVDEARAKRIADAFEAMEHNPDDPLVKASYDAMIGETLAQWQAIKETGLVVDFITGDDPYGNPRNAILDVVENNHLWVYPTDAGFGGSASADVDISGNPLLQVIPGEKINGRPVRANDIFRIVHDYFGHIKEGVGFRAEGEENAWRAHAAMYSPLARMAMTTETRGQNSWVNFGPFAEHNRTANGAETQYAPQKIGLLPDWVVNEGAFDEEPASEMRLNQGAAFNVQELLARESMGDFPLVRTADGALLLNIGKQSALFLEKKIPVLDNRPRFQERANKVAEAIGEPIEVVTEDDPRLEGAVSEILEAPPVDERGMIQLQHWSMSSDLTRTDPDAWGRNINFLPKSEKQRLGSAIGRTYFGIASGEPGGYKVEFGPNSAAYVGEVEASRLYDIMADPDGFKKTLAGQLDSLERAIKDAGYAGYWVKNGQLGLVATVFEPVDVRPAPEASPQGAYRQKTRGYITFGQDVSAIPSTITLLNASDLSTFLHESGHFFLEVMSHMAAQPGAPKEVVDDMAAALKWMGVDSHTKWIQMTLAQKRQFHEKFARGFEAYLFEGRAPNAEIRSIFQRFSAWIKAVYKNRIANLRAPLNDEIRGVFDRMIASAETIQAAEDQGKLAPIFSEKPVGMTDTEWLEYQELGVSATAEAIDELQARSLRDMRFAKKAHARELKRLQAQVAEQRALVEEEIRNEIGSQPVYRAMEFLRRGTVNGDPVEGPHKLALAEVKAAYQLAEPDFFKKAFGYGKYGMLAEDGVHPNQVAELFGFTSGSELLRAIVTAPDFQTEVDAATELRLLERYGDINSPEALDAAASAAIHNDVRARFVATELAALDKGVGKPRLLAKAARQYAEALISRLKVREVRPSQYEAAERRAAVAAMTAVRKGDTATATAEKRNQLLNLHATRAARDAQEEVRKTIDYFRKFASKGVRAKIDPDYLDQIDGMLDRFELRTGVSDAQLAKRKSLADWIDAQRERGFEPLIDPALGNEARRQSYRDLTIDELAALRDAIRNIEHLGRLKTKLLKNKEQRELAEAVEAGAAAIRDNAYKTKTQNVGAKTWADHVRSGFDDFFAMHRKFSSLIREMDGSKDGGVLWGLFVRPMNDAGDAEANLTAEATVKLQDIFNQLVGENTQKRVFEPAIGQSISLETRLMVALNWGNETNRARIKDGDNWSDEQVAAILAPLTAKHWKFVQDVWAHINSYWPEVAAKEKRVTGVEPEKVEADPFNITTSDGVALNVPGGYFPIKYDPDRSSKAEADTANEVQQQLSKGLYTRATTRRGHTKARVDKVERAIRKDFSVIFQHNGEVIHDLAWHETLIDLNRLLRAGQIDSAIRDHYGPAALRWMRKALEDIAIGGLPAQNVLERGVNYLRAGATVAGLGWNLMTSLFQPLGLTNSIVRIGPKYVARGISRVFKDAATMNATTTWINEQSTFMRLRAQTQQREIAEVRQQFAAKGPVRNTLDRVPGAAPTLDAVQASYFVLITKAQLIADVPTWVGGYEKAIDEGNSHERAVAMADQAVIDSQGGGQIKDLAGIQRGGPFMKLWTNFYSWFSVAYNQLAESVNDTRRVGPSRLPLLAVDFLLIATVPQLVTSLLRGAIGGDDWDELRKRIMNDQLSGYLGFFFGLRELGAMFGIGNSYSGPAGARAIDATVKLGKQAQQGDADEAFFKAVNNAAGILFHYPAGQVQRTWLGVEALADGKTKNPMVILTGPPPKR